MEEKPAFPVSGVRDSGVLLDGRKDGEREIVGLDGKSFEACESFHEDSYTCMPHDELSSNARFATVARWRVCLVMAQSWCLMAATACMMAGQLLSPSSLWRQGQRQPGVGIGGNGADGGLENGAIGALDANEAAEMFGRFVES